MYGLEQLQQKTFRQLKEIGWQLNVLPEDDKRCRLNWINALVGVQPPLLELLENIPGVKVEAQALTESSDTSAASPGVEVEAQALPETSDTSVASPTAKVDRALEPIECSLNGYHFQEPDGRRYVYRGHRRFYIIEATMEEAVDMNSYGEPVYPEWPEGWLSAPEIVIDAESKFGRIVYRQPTQRPIAQTAETEPKVSQSAIAQTAENSPGVTATLTDADRWNPADFGEVLHKVEASGQINLLEWEDTNEPPDPDDYGPIEDFRRAYDIWELENCVQGAGAIDLQLHNGYIKQSNSGENNHGEFSGTDTESVGADEIAIGAELPSGCDCCAKLHGTSGHNQNEGLGSQKGDRLLEESRPDSGDTGRALSHQPPELVSDAILDYLREIGHQIAPNITPQAAFNDEQPPNRGDGRKSGKLAIGIQVGRRIDLRALGTIRNIYTSKKGKLRAKIEPPKKAGFVYVDCDRLIEQQFIPYDHPQPLGPWKNTGNTVTFRSDICDVWVRKEKPPAPTNWTVAELTSMSLLSLKAIARDMAIFSIPGTAAKRSLTRAILAEQTIASEKRQPTEINTAPTKTDKTPQQLSINVFPAVAAPTPILASKPAVKPRKKLSEAIGQQLSLFDVA